MVLDTTTLISRMAKRLSWHVGLVSFVLFTSHSAFLSCFLVEKTTYSRFLVTTYRSRNVGCLWDASILCRKNEYHNIHGIYISLVFWIFVSSYITTCHPKVRWHLATFLTWTWTLDLTKLLSNELVADNAVFFQRLFAWLARWLCFHRAFFTRRANRLCFHKDSCD